MVRKKNPEKTRQQIIEMAGDLIHKHGFKGMRVDEIAEKTGLTKGAIYHHFPNKQALGYAVVDELFYKMFNQYWGELLKSKGPPLEVIASSFNCMGNNMCESDVEIGCPLINLGSEMSFEDEGFRIRINKVFDEWSDQLEALLKTGIEQGSIKADIDVRKTANFLVASFQGIQCNSKYTKSLEKFRDGLEYLSTIVMGLGIQQH
jgi:TetR/AcrR family transcriptional repressor of nem operon